VLPRGGKESESRPRRANFQALRAAWLRFCSFGSCVILAYLSLCCLFCSPLPSPITSAHGLPVRSGRALLPLPNGLSLPSLAVPWARWLVRMTAVGGLLTTDPELGSGFDPRNTPPYAWLCCCLLIHARCLSVALHYTVCRCCVRLGTPLPLSAVTHLPLARTVC